MPALRQSSDGGPKVALLHGPEQIADLPVPVVESPSAVRIGHPERGHLVEYLAPNSVFNSLPRQRSSPHLRRDDRLVTIDRVAGGAWFPGPSTSASIPSVFDGRAELVFNIYMERKLVQIGKSLAVTLPVEVVKDLKLEKGQTVDCFGPSPYRRRDHPRRREVFRRRQSHKAVPRAHSSSAGKTQ